MVGRKNTPPRQFWTAKIPPNIGLFVRFLLHRGISEKQQILGQTVKMPFGEPYGRIIWHLALFAKCSGRIGGWGEGFCRGVFTVFFLQRGAF